MTQSSDSDLIRGTVILEGGAARGVFSSGALDCLMEENIYLSHVIGVSAGSSNAADYVSRQIGRTRDCMIHKEKELEYIGMKSLITQHSLFDMEMLFDRYPNDLFPFDYDTFFDSPMKCEIVVTNCRTGRAEYKTAQKGDREKLMKYLTASSSMPFVSPVVTIDGEPYVDGSVADSVPIQRAKTYGNHRIVAILTRNAAYMKEPMSRAELRVAKRRYCDYPNLIRAMQLRYIHYNKTTEYLDKLEKAGRIFVLRPSIPLIARAEKDYDNLMHFYDHGYEEMRRRLGDLRAYLAKQ